VSVITLVALMSVFFSKSKTAAALGTMGFFALYFPYYSVMDPVSNTFAQKQAACLLSPVRLLPLSRSLSLSHVFMIF
jgi:hypothetical protein